ncbi:phospholipid-binding protein, PBP family [Natronoarchaeum philippinense]|uniref:Phospholipid-binding protein, PBP family n=2 Tax=Natronoarchaeum philippinense TaxID=558529 RepID=A0A285NT05_NATPI|nr:YbhB/YbcL family Raf kinase inhibitor-like protein [Natronoarchaeum philippinense]SNZ12579.1 phospholipid-binding protein, PBP family [Natronoarchaeum philippinense]
MPRPIGRRTLLAGAAIGVAGCLDGAGGDAADGDTGGTDGDIMSDSETPAHGDAEQRGDLSLTSSAFGNGERIPDQYGRDGRDVNPPLSIGGVPDGAASLALVVDDPDARAPAGKVWVHWLVWNLDPSREQIPENWNAADATEGTNDFGEVGYGGPAPPDREHTYRFKCYALDETLGLTRGATKDELGAAMAGSVLAQTQLTGTFAP